MNYKTMLLASAAVLFASQAMAQDLTGAFSVPGKGQIMSETNLGLTRTKTKYDGVQNAEDGRYIEQTIEYGICDKLSVNAAIINEFDVEGDYNNDHNFAYSLGAKYNTRFDDVLFQVAVDYETWDPKDFYGHRGNDLRWQKNIGMDLKAGLDLGNGVTPYAIYHIDSDIDTAHRELTQSVSVGVHKYAGKWALDGAVRYEWEKNAKSEFMGVKGKNETSTWFDVAGDYYLRDNVALGLYGSYLIDSHDATWSDGTKEHTNSDYELGLRVKVLF